MQLSVRRGSQRLWITVAPEVLNCWTSAADKGSTCRVLAGRRQGDWDRLDTPSRRVGAPEPSVDGRRTLSRGVERLSIGARPLERVYSPRQVRRLLRDAADVATSVGGFNSSDTPLTDLLSRYLSVLQRPETLAGIGRIGGWYVLGFGRRA
jgi:hypothetical protein